MKAVAGAVLAVCLISTHASATETPLALYQSGHFAQAEEAGLAQNNAAGIAVAARAVLADDAMRDDPCLDCLKHAEELSRRAVAADPRLPEGHIYLAAAIGYEFRIIGIFAAQSKGYGDEIKRQLDAALASDPNNPWALAALGSWNIEIVHSGGAPLARLLFGATFATGMDYYAKAIALAPANPVLHYQYALALSAFDLEEYRQDVENELARVIALNPGSTYETFIRERAQQLLGALRGGDPAEVERLIKRDQGYPDAS